MSKCYHNLISVAVEKDHFRCTRCNQKMHMDQAVSWLYDEVNARQAKIDSLMQEYCPDEMTPEQWDEWGRNQVMAEEWI